MTVWLEATALVLLRPCVSSRLRVIVQRDLVLVSTDIGACNTLVSTASLLNLETTAAASEVSISLTLWLGIP